MQHHTSKEVTNAIIKYEDVFSEDIFKQHKATELYNQLLAKRNNIIQSIPVANNTGPVHGAHAVQNRPILSQYS